MFIEKGSWKRNYTEYEAKGEHIPNHAPSDDCLLSLSAATYTTAYATVRIIKIRITHLSMIFTNSNILLIKVSIMLIWFVYNRTRVKSALNYDWQICNDGWYLCGKVKLPINHSVAFSQG